MTIRTTLFPPANRTAALVAFLRTFWQTVRAVGGLTVLGGGALVVGHVTTIDWPAVGVAAAGVIASGLIAGLISGGDILANGLPAAYSASTAPSSITGTIAARHAVTTGTMAPTAAPTPATNTATMAAEMAVIAAEPIPAVVTVLPTVQADLPPAPTDLPNAPTAYTPNPLTGI